MKVVKFGGKSLANGKGLQHVLEIIISKIKKKEQNIYVLSARGSATNDLERILEKAKRNTSYKKAFQEFKDYQLEPNATIDFSEEFDLLGKIFEGVNLLGDYSPKIKDLVLAHGELLAGKLVVSQLTSKGIQARFVDSRNLLKTDTTFGEAELLEELTKYNVVEYFKNTDPNEVQIVTGFIASSIENETTTLGRNGSNYSAALLANYLDAETLENYTHVDGIYTANPDLVSNARKIENLSFKEANELANFGAYILNAKAMIPLIEKGIPLRILNTFDTTNEGTLITKDHKSKDGIKAISVLENMALINLEGKGLLGKVGVDARVFTALQKENISVSIISQGSSERGISFVVNANQSRKAREALANEFNLDFISKDVTKIEVRQNVSVVSTLGKTLASFNSSYSALIRNSIEPILMNNTVAGRNVCLVIDNKDLHKAVNVIHGEIFGVSKKINIAVFGVGLVGGTLVDQILESKSKILARKGVELNIFAVANSKKVVLNAQGIQNNWKKTLAEEGQEIGVAEVVAFADTHHLENLIAVDNTASAQFVDHYISLVESGFNLVSSNKIGNTISFEFYEELRRVLKKNKKSYLYETNVGAGLPLIDTIRVLHYSGENITRIKGVFSGTLSYLFNNYSANDEQFSQVLKGAVDQGFTEPDPREDLNGNDVGRKLLILARELELKNEFSDVQIHNLIPETLRDGDTATFLNNLEQFDPIYKEIKEQQEPGNVLRYIGDLHGDLSQDKGILEVKLISVSPESALGQVKGADSIFEIYTESYGERPIVIQGAGAGAHVTARGVFGDILRLSESGL
ncbi:bifunctional aspartate kinase/homoserine dehydrogenase I [Flavicella sediminum]|uniref:bifunctional aspartate kinase/homoserine dehydrogenase I n=1 Tax=Flavicella sediminum TaxID=2585141 RepID=UPI00111ED400|nr:bifunctional aspartate kinase/homoserine dehydrogenase I [Flavicella sediminum]